MSESLQRPALTSTLTSGEFARWYWLREELVVFARECGLPSSGGKQALASRVSAYLGGDCPPELPARRTQRGNLLKGPFCHSTPVPPGQSCSQSLRAWFTAELRSTFHFDAAMRAWFAEADGTRTLGAAVAHWRATRSIAASEIAPQFEFNRFIREWHRSHAGASRREAVAAWKHHRSLPTDARKA